MLIIGVPDVICFFLKPTGKRQRYLRRYADKKCDGASSYHNAKLPFDVVLEVMNDRGFFPVQEYPHDAPGWPPSCQCGYKFEDGDQWQVSTEQIMRRSDTGQELVLSDAPPGAMWYADWHPTSMRGHDGHSLVVRLPNGRDWCIDGEANNCTAAGDQLHRCWCRHGLPPMVTVNKVPLPLQRTCSAGAGSIQAGDYHGFLTNGVLRSC